MKPSPGGIDEVGDFFGAQDAGQMSRFLWIRCLGHAPGFLNRPRVEESQSRESLRHRGRSKLSFAEQIRLVLADVLRSELIRRSPEITREIFDGLDVAVYGRLSVITTLEFFEHHFAKVGHRLAPYDPTLFPHKHRRHLARECVCREAASFKHRFWGCHHDVSLSDFSTTQCGASIVFKQSGSLDDRRGRDITNLGSKSQSPALLGATRIFLGDVCAL